MDHLAYDVATNEEECKAIFRKIGEFAGYELATGVQGEEGVINIGRPEIFEMPALRGSSTIDLGRVWCAG